MKSLRRHLRNCAAAWLVFQAASLSAFVPRDCCAAHRPTTERKEHCDESAAARRCPMKAADGTPCPMHQGHDAHAGHHRNPTNECSLRGTCDGPMAALFTLLSHHGILPEPFSTMPRLELGAIATAARESVAGRLEPPDSPPPRA